MLDGRFVQIPYLDRFVENRYCPVCHTRCQGFLLMGMAWCTQEGRARPGCDYFKGAYSHLLVGTCHCGQKHDRVVAFVHPPVPLTPTPRQDEPESLGAVLPDQEPTELAESKPEPPEPLPAEPVEVEPVATALTGLIGEQPVEPEPLQAGASTPVPTSFDGAIEVEPPGNASGDEANGEPEPLQALQASPPFPTVSDEAVEARRNSEIAPPSPRSRVCRHCDKQFTPARSDALFCSPRCRVANHRKSGKMISGVDSPC